MPGTAEQMFCIVCGESGYNIRTCRHPYLYPHAILSQEDALSFNMSILEDESDVEHTCMYVENAPYMH